MTMLAALESQHGVMMHYQGFGILICGDAGIGKSSLALELIQHGAILIADDVVDFSIEANQLIAHCPKNLSGLLHTRELGLIDIREVYGDENWQPSSTADLCIELKLQHYPEASLTSPKRGKQIHGHSLTVLTLSLNNPASLKTRIDCWLAMQKNHLSDVDNLHLWQQHQMAFTV